MGFLGEVYLAILATSGEGRDMGALVYLSSFMGSKELEQIVHQSSRNLKLVRTGQFLVLFMTLRLVLLIAGASDIEIRRLMARYDRNILKFISVKFRLKIPSFDMVRTLVFETLKF